MKPLTISVTDLDGEGENVKYSEKSLTFTVLSHSLLNIKVLGEAKDFLS